MMHKCALALIAAMLLATPALAIETQPPTASPKVSRNQAPNAGAKQHTKTKAGSQTAGTLRPPAKIPSTKGAKAIVANVAKKQTQRATALPATKKAKHAKSAKPKSKIAKSKTPDASNHRNSNHAMTRSRPAENRTPADTTGSVPPTPGLY
jgi:hypothetical protein